MVPFKRVLFPVDYSASCAAMVPYVKDMTRHFSADLTLVHAYALHPVFASRDIEGVLVYSDLAYADPKITEEIRQTEAERLSAFAAEEFPGQRVDLLTEEGEPGAVIHKVLQHQGADLVMMPTQGAGVVRRFLLGSVTAKVLHDISAAVWTSTGAAMEQHAPPYKSIICAVDETPESEAVARAAAAMAKSYQANLELVHVLEMPPATPEIDFTPYRQDLIDAGHAHMRGLKGRLNLDVPDVVIDAGVADGIREEIVRRKADLLVLGRGHDQGIVSRVWSRLYAIVRDSPCPVLSV